MGEIISIVLLYAAKTLVMHTHCRFNIYLRIIGYLLLTFTKHENWPALPDALIIRRAALKLENWAITGWREALWMSLVWV